MQAVAADLLEVLDRGEPGLDRVDALRVLEVVHRVGLWDAGGEAELERLALGEAELLELAQRQLHEVIVGHLPELVAGDHELEGQLSGADPADFPRLSQVFGVGREQSRDTVFEIALEAVLDGIERRFVMP